MSLNSVQSFVIESCNGPTIENGLNNVCLHPLSRTFTFTFIQDLELILVHYNHSEMTIYSNNSQSSSSCNKADFKLIVDCRDKAWLRTGADFPVSSSLFEVL